MNKIPSFIIFNNQASIKLSQLLPISLLIFSSFYDNIVEKLNAGEEVDEGLIGGLALAGVGALAGPAIGKAICTVLGVDPKGNLGKLLTSRLVTAALGFELGK